ncbi:alpha/beta hydrolase [Chelatococcus sp. SYSU_G07232]|uniref:Alpha/beta hydrolase n=1 Tax=Chelatococcus albus TaxID=3047466 RepID=A0ABT7AFD8_9HYPH|nr:alpha/beta hydrolase [Chelatococcus sp. SYSU_G07232]MDJ1158084.1 alpha/beta hydrolase [Chelatococcus sp. SYSU_G07232]
MSKTILLIHGAWLTPAIWQPWIDRYEAQGYKVLAPAWPLMDRPAEELRRAPHPELGKLTLGKIVDHYAAIIATLPEQPVLIGHSYGGLIVQMLLDRGLGAAGVSIDPGLAAGIKPGAKAFLSALPVFLAWCGWSRALSMSSSSSRRTLRMACPSLSNVRRSTVISSPHRAASITSRCWASVRPSLGRRPIVRHCS